MRIAKTASILLLIAFIAVGCANSSDATETTVPSTSTPTILETTPVTEETEPPEITESDLPPLLDPYGEAEDLSFMSYEEYFSQQREYEYGEMNRDCLWEWPLREGFEPTQYSIQLRDGNLVVRWDATGELRHTILSWDDYRGQNCKWVVADGYWIYFLRDGRELFRVDYHGENYEALFVDGMHTLDYKPGNFFLADHCTLFFPIYEGETVAICRLYLPEKKLDILCQTDASIFSSYLPRSNHEITWVEENSELSDIIEAEIADANSPFYQYSREAALFAIPAAYHIPIHTSYYINTQTGEQYSLDYYGNYATATNRTQENIEKNGDEWWKDFQ